MPRHRFDSSQPRYARSAGQVSIIARPDPRESRRALYAELDLRRRRAQIAARHALDEAEHNDSSEPIARLA
jgi:hypothetical protein